MQVRDADHAGPNLARCVFLGNQTHLVAKANKSIPKECLSIQHCVVRMGELTARGHGLSIESTDEQLMSMARRILFASYNTLLLYSSPAGGGSVAVSNQSKEGREREKK